MRSVRVAVSIPRLVTAAVIFGALAVCVQTLPQSSQPQMPRRPQTTAVKNTVPRPAAPQPAGESAPAVPPAPAPQTVSAKPRPTVKTPATAQAAYVAKAPPAIVASPDARVTGLQPAGGVSVLPSAAVTYTSTNWSGYMATAGPYTAISGSWTVPSAAGDSRRNSADATWIGIGGITSSDLIQVGTKDTIMRSGKQASSAFYELSPNSPSTITSMSVRPGDVISASLAETSGGQWAISISNVTTGRTYTTTVSYSSSQSSAEWIEEDPSYRSGRLMPLDSFGAIAFTGGSATTAAGTLSLSDSGAQPIIMLAADNTPAVSPSPIGTDGKSFTVARP